MWAGFRVGRRARPGGPRIEHRSDSISVEGTHDGYSHLAGRPLHRRRWQFDGAGLVVEDDVSDAGSAALARFHLAPGLTLAPAADQSHWRSAAGASVIAEVAIVAGRGHAEASFHSPRFGAVEATSCLAVALERGRATTRWTWAR